MNDIFKPDIFSVSRQVTSVVSTEMHEEISALLGRHFQRYTNARINVSQFGGMEINSNNFLIRDGNAACVLKKFNILSEQSRQLVSHQLRLSMQLREAGLPLPVFFKPDSSDAFLFSDQESDWVLMAFVEGDFFAGGTVEHTNAVKVILDLWNTLSAIHPPPELPIIQPVGKDDAELLTSVWTINNFSAGFTGLSTTDLCNMLHQIEHELLTVLAISSDLMAPVSACHIDLHPHNILMKNTDVAAILDVESFQIAPTYPALAFNLFKLSRQAVVFQKMNAIQINALKSDIHRLVEQRHVVPDLSKLNIYAKAEILRRIFIILRLNLQGNFRWNHVLPIQINALKEADLTI